MALLFSSPDNPADAWRAELQARIPDLDVRIWPEVGDPAVIEVALVWRPPPASSTAVVMTALPDREAARSRPSS